MTVSTGWAIARVWAERVPFDYATLADLAGMPERAARARAHKEGWRVRDVADAASGLARLRARLWSKVDAAANVDDDATVDKAALEAIQVLMRAIDRLEQSQPAEDPVSGEGEMEIAALLRRIDERINELARDMAGREHAENQKHGA